MMTIWAECWVHASHEAGGFPMRGHSYLVRVYVTETPEAFQNADHLFAHLKEVSKGLDDKCLNDVLAVPSMEAMASWIAREVGKTYPVAKVTITRPEGLGCKYVCPSMEKT